jgi:DNA transposition AAA+ family ATPase
MTKGRVLEDTLYVSEYGNTWLITTSTQHTSLTAP